MTWAVPTTVTIPMEGGPINLVMPMEGGPGEKPVMNEAQQNILDWFMEGYHMGESIPVEDPIPTLCHKYDDDSSCDSSCDSSENS